MIPLDHQYRREIPGAPGKSRVLWRESGYLGEGEQALWVVRDRPESGASGFRWIICPPVGIDYMNAYRGLRHMAEALAGEGHELWRFDYPQTGSSADPRQENQVALWTDSITRLIDHLRGLSPDAGIGLIGFRFGATLAALASCQRGVEALVCWSPLIKGSQLVRQTLLLQQAAEQRQEEDLLEAAGWVLNAVTRESLSAINLLRCSPAAGEILVIDSESAMRSGRLAGAWQDPARVRHEIIDEAPLLQVDAHLTGVPRQTIGRICDWAAEVVNGNDREPSPVSGNGRPGLVAPARLQVHPEGSESAQTVIEDAGYLGSALFAVHCRPARESGDDKPLVLLLNSGSNHQVGPNRLYVTLARLLAAGGIESLRLDLPGLGETPAIEGDDENLPYPPNPVQAMQQAVDALDPGDRPLILVGLCSGAYHGFLGAIELRADIREVILINPLTFYWEQGMQLEDAPSASYGEWSWYQQSLRDPDRWKRLLSGRINPWPIAVSVARRLLLKQKILLRRVLERFEPRQPNRITPSLRNSLRKIEDRGIHLSLLFSETDPGLAIIRDQADRQLQAMRKRGTAEMLLIRQADHTLSRRHARLQLVAWLRDHFGLDPD
jgi:pimeloyl-ACP methyl ester carboxylesterase